MANKKSLSPFLPPNSIQLAADKYASLERREIQLKNYTTRPGSSSAICAYVRIVT